MRTVSNSDSHLSTNSRPVTPGYRFFSLTVNIRSVMEKAAGYNGRNSPHAPSHIPGLNQAKDNVVWTTYSR